MTPQEQVEYAGLAAAVGRLMDVLQKTEAVLAEVIIERDALLAKQAAP